MKKRLEGGLLVTEDELTERAQQEDKEAYKELIRSHQQKVESFAYQCGVHTSDLTNVAQAVFVKLYRFLPKCPFEQFKIQLFKMTLSTIHNGDVRMGAESAQEITNDSKYEHILRFEEDQLLHEAIQTLDQEHRPPFVLFYFHQLSYEEISEVLGSSLTSIKTSILSAEENLKTALAREETVKIDDKQFQKRLELLKKSYDRISLQLVPDDVIVQIEAEEEQVIIESTVPTTNLRPKWEKPTIWVAGIVGVLLVGLLVKPYVYTEIERTEVSGEVVSTSEEYDELLKAMLKKYDRKREEVGKELLVSADELASFGFIKSADSMMEYFKTASDVYEFSPNLDSIEQNLLNALMTPRQAIELIDSYEQLSFEESYFIYELYQHSIEELNAFYTQLVEPYAYLLAVPTETKQFPSELQAIIKAANRQFLELQLDKEGVRFKANPIDSEFAPDSIQKLHPDVLGYFEYTKNGYLLLVNDLRYSREETLKSLQVIERTLLVDANEGNTNYGILKTTFENAWMALLKGTTNYPAKTKNNQYDAQYIQFLQKTAAGEYGVVIEEIAATILKEIQETNHSETLEQLSVERVQGALLQMREVPTYDELASGHFSVLEMSESLKEQIQNLYTQSTQSSDETLINELLPINLSGRYLYANIMNDHRVMNAVTMKGFKINTSTLQQITHLDDISEIGASTGFYPVVTVRLTAGNQFILKFAFNEDGQYRIDEIRD